MQYGYIGTMKTTPGHRDDVVAILLDGIDGLRSVGCNAYIPEVRASIAKAMPMLTGEFTSEELTVVGGLGLSSPTRD